MSTPISPRVLVVDDFETVRLLLAKNLRELGITNIVQAENGKEALRLIIEAEQNNAKFDLVFVDWNMPVMDGHELLLAVRKLLNFKDLPFVMVTSNSDDGAVVSAIRSGVSEYVQKPFDTASLQRTIERVLVRFKTVTD